jgi:predicted GNAT family N-acyltransferase
MSGPLVLVVDPMQKSGPLVEQALTRDFGSSFQLVQESNLEKALQESEEAIPSNRLALVLVAGVDPAGGARALASVRRLSTSTATVQVIEADELERAPDSVNNAEIDRLLVRSATLESEIREVLAILLRRWQSSRSPLDGQALLQVHRATSRDEKEAVYRLRYQIYVEEMKTKQRFADHERRVVEEAHDAYAHHFYLQAGDRLVGSLRLNVMSEGEMECQESYGVDVLTKWFRPSEIGMLTRFLVASDYRGRAAAQMLIGKAFEYCAEKRLRCGLLDCLPHLIKYYEAIGFRRYVDSFEHEDFGYETPMLFATEDVEYLEKIGSPMVALVRQAYGHNAETVAFLLEHFPRLAGYTPDTMLDEERLWKVLCAKLAARPVDKLSLVEGLREKEAKRFVKAGHRFITRGEEESMVYVLLSGSADVRTGGRSMAVCGPGEVLGEFAMLTHQARSADVVALEDSEFLTFSERSFQRLIDSEPSLAAGVLWNLARQLSRKLVASNRRTRVQSRQESK